MSRKSSGAAPVNQPKIAEARQHWDPENERGWFEALKAIPAMLKHMREFGFFLAPNSMDLWDYRSRLKDLDPVCLRTLREHGALSAEELAEWLNRDGVLRMNTERTGISHVTDETVRDWIELARRRDLLISLPYATSSPGADDFHWALSSVGREAVRSPFQKVMARMPASSPTALVGGVGFLVGWLAKNQLALIISAFLVAVAIYLVLLMLVTAQSKRRDRPGVAVVAIETVRCYGRQPPSLCSPVVTTG